MTNGIGVSAPLIANYFTIKKLIIFDTCHLFQYIYLILKLKYYYETSQIEKIFFLKVVTLTECPAI